MASNSAFLSLPPEEQQRLLNKLAKLKALSECKTGNVNETATAAAHMTRLMLEYQIEIADLQSGGPREDEAIVTEELNGETSRRGFPGWQTNLLAHLAQANGCISYTDSESHYRLWHRETLSRLRLIGTRDDIQNTRNLFIFCLQEIECLCHKWNPRAPVARKNDFRTGAVIGIGEKVAREREAVLAEEKSRAQAKGQTSQALALFDRRQDAVDDKAAEIGLVFTRRSRSRGVSINAFEAGYQAGASLNLSGKPAPALAAQGSL